jgi:hypothetical protein
MLGNSEVAAQRAASHERLSSLELISVTKGASDSRLWLNQWELLTLEMAAFPQTTNTNIRSILVP